MGLTALIIYDVYGTLKHSDSGYDFYGSWMGSSFNKILFDIGKNMAGWTMYVDVIGYDWIEPYNSGDNKEEGLLLNVDHDDLENMKYLDEFDNKAFKNQIWSIMDASNYNLNSFIYLNKEIKQINVKIQKK